MVANTETGGSAVGLRPRRRMRSVRVLVAACVTLVTCAVAVVAGGGGAVSAASGPKCSFSNSFAGLPLVMQVSPGTVVNISCRGLPDSTSYLLVEASLLVAIDPAAKGLLTGTSVTSLLGLEALIAATPELNADPLTWGFPSSNASGDLTYAYTVPSTQPTDPNATCPPSTEQLNSGLIGCAVAMIDLSTFKPVTQGTFVMNYKGQPILPPNPTLALSIKALPSTKRRPPKMVTVSDAPGAKTYWWLATLASIEDSLGGASGGGSIPVVVQKGSRTLKSNAAVAPATYNGRVFTPPKLSGSFTTNASRGKITVLLSENLLGFPYAIYAEQTLQKPKAKR